MLLMTVRTATRDQIEKFAEADHASEEVFSKKRSELEGGTGGGYKDFQFVHSAFSPIAVTRSTEARLLACVARAVDEALETNGSTVSLENGMAVLRDE